MYIYPPSSYHPRYSMTFLTLKNSFMMFLFPLLAKKELLILLSCTIYNFLQKYWLLQLLPLCRNITHQLKTQKSKYS